jgi:hypothetical protein
MTRSTLGQMITLAVQVDHDPSAAPAYVMVPTRINDTVQKIVARLGHPENARAVANLNGVRSTTQVLLHRQRERGDLTRVRVPSRLRPEQVLNVLAGNAPPRIVGGYAKFSTIDRFSRTALTQFAGYDPLTMEVPLSFEAMTGGGDGADVESQIRLLERMAGRGAFVGAGIGPPPVIRASTTDASGNVVGLIPTSFQWTKATAGPLWRVSGLAWDDGAIRDTRGNRIRAGCTVTLMEHTHAALVSQTAAARAR